MQTLPRLSLPLSNEDAADLEKLRQSPDFIREEKLEENPSKASAAAAIFQEGLKVIKEREYAKLYAEMAAEKELASTMAANRARLTRRGRDTIED